MRNVFVYILGFLLIFISINVINFFIPNEIFHSPDESAYYQVVKEYGDHGKMDLDGKYLDIDTGSNLHSRGFLTHNNKIITFNFLGIPLFYGTFYSYFQDIIKFINIIFIFIIFIYIYKLLELFGILTKKQIGYVFLGILGSPILLYFFNYSYYNIIPFLTFLLLFLYYIFKRNRTGKISYLYFGIFFSLIATWMRYEQIIFIILFMLVNILSNYKLYKKYFKNHILFIIGLSIISFMIPLLILNKELYGEYFTYGYSLFIQFTALTNEIKTVLGSIIHVFFPAQQFDLTILWINIKNNLFLISPFFYLLGYLALAQNSIFRKIGYYRIIIIYILLYLGMSPTYGSGVDDRVIHNSINRYWFVIQLFVIFLFIIYIKGSFKTNKIYILLISFFVFTLGSHQYYNELVGQLQHLGNSYGHTYLHKYFSKGSNNYLISPQFDKVTFSYIHPITWRGGEIGGDLQFEKVKNNLISTVKYLIYTGESVYGLEGIYFNQKYHFKEFGRDGIGFKHIEKNLYQLYLLDEAK